MFLMKSCVTWFQTITTFRCQLKTAPCTQADIPFSGDRNAQETHALIDAYNPQEILLQDVKRSETKRLLTRMLRDAYGQSDGQTKVVAVSGYIFMLGFLNFES